MIFINFVTQFQHNEIQSQVKSLCMMKNIITYMKREEEQKKQREHMYKINDQKIFIIFPLVQFFKYMPLTFFPSPTNNLPNKYISHYFSTWLNID